MRTRPSARIILLDQFNCVLLFKFTHSGKSYWATPGGAVEHGETFHQAALRELEEETGLPIDNLGEEIGKSSFELELVDGEVVWAEERFFAAKAERGTISSQNRTGVELEVMAAHRWWSVAEIAKTNEIIFPEMIMDLIKKAADKPP